MSNLTLDQFYSSLAVIIALCTVVGFFLGKQSDAKKQGRCEGEESTGIKKDIEYLTGLVRDLKEEFRDVKQKMDDNTKENTNFHIEQAQEITRLDASYRSLHKRVDFLFDQLKLKEVYHDTGDGFGK